MDGRCLCGAVTVRTTSAPIAVRACWCRDCQRLAGGGATQNAFFASEAVAVEGELRWHTHVADSGTPLDRGFCIACGAHMLVQSHARRHIMGVRIGVFDDVSALAPQVTIWTDSAPSWAWIDPTLPSYPRQPPPVVPVSADGTA